MTDTDNTEHTLTFRIEMPSGFTYQISDTVVNMDDDVVPAWAEACMVEFVGCGIHVLSGSLDGRDYTQEDFDRMHARFSV